MDQRAPVSALETTASEHAMSRVRSGSRVHHCGRPGSPVLVRRAARPAPLAAGAKTRRPRVLVARDFAGWQLYSVRVYPAHAFASCVLLQKYLEGHRVARISEFVVIASGGVRDDRVVAQL